MGLFLMKNHFAQCTKARGQEDFYNSYNRISFENKHHCSVCHMTFSDEHYPFTSLRYLEEHLESPYLTHGDHQCNLCPKSYAGEEGLSFHLDIYHGKLVCNICKSRFFFKSLLEDHVKVTHKGKPHDKISHFDLSSLIKTTIEKRNNQPRHWCNVGSCSENFIQEVDLQKHIEKDHRLWCKIKKCSKCFTDAVSLQTHIKKDHKNLFCELCQLQKYCELTLMIHNKHHHDPSVLKPYKCDVCGESFVCESILKIHFSKQNH